MHQIKRCSNTSAFGSSGHDDPGTLARMMYVEARRKLVAWMRRQLIGPTTEGSLRMSPLDRYPTGVLHPVDPDLSGIDVRARPHGDGLILTVTLCNRGELDPGMPVRLRGRDRVKKSLFEERLECAIESGELIEYPRVDPSLLTDEERELELQYRERRIYAIGTTQPPESRSAMSVNVPPMSMPMQYPTARFLCP